MKKWVFACLLSTVLVFLISISSFAAEQIGHSLGHAEQLEIIVSKMIAQRQAEIISSKSVDFRQPENLHLHPNYMRGVDPRNALLVEFLEMLEIANQSTSTISAQRTSISSLEDAPGAIIPITMLPGNGFSGDKFFLGFSDEDYFSLLNPISEFTGIEKEMFEFWVVGEIRFPTLEVRALSDMEIRGLSDMEIRKTLPPIDDSFVESFSTTTLTMGTPIYFLLPKGEIMGPASLGHPTSTAGTRAYSASHGVIPVGSTVILGNWTEIGRVVRSEFDHRQGIDVSLIQLNNGFVVSRGSLTNFHGSLPTGSTWPALTVYSLQGIRPATGIGFIRVDFGNGIVFNNMIGVRTGVISGDSGSALVASGNQAVGALMGDF